MFLKCIEPEILLLISNHISIKTKLSPPPVFKTAIEIDILYPLLRLPGPSWYQRLVKINGKIQPI